jgi:hypothetical protein
MKRDLRFSRRNLLKILGAGMAMLPILESDPADAACFVSGIKRLFVFAWCNGMMSNVSTWATTGTSPAAWNVASFQGVPPSGKSLLPGMPAASLADFKSDLMLLHGIDYDFISQQPNPTHAEHNGHACFPGMLSGSNFQSFGTGTSTDVGGGISIDQYIGQQLVQEGYKGIPSLSLGAFVKSTGRLSWKGAGQAVVPDDNPYHVFSTYFAGKLPTTTTMPTPMDAGSTLDPKVVMGKSVLDYVLGDLNRFSKVVGTADKLRIQAHMQSIRDMEMTLQGASGGGMSLGDGGAVMQSGEAACNVPGAAATAASKGTQLDTTLTGNIPALIKMQFDMSVAAFAADMTRVVVCQVGDQGDANLIMSWLGFAKGGPNPADNNTGDLNGYHSIAHRNDADKTTCDTWFQQQLAYMVGQMKAITDPTGASILDSSLLLAMNNMRTGTHETTAVPVVMAGKLGGFFKTGQSLALTGVNNNRLLLSILEGFGYPSTTFGTATYCGGGPITQLHA